MNKICNYCEHQYFDDNNGGVKCRAAKYLLNNYGNHKQGATCINDSDLKPLFAPRDEGSGNVVEMAEIIKRQRQEMSKLRDTIVMLKERIIKVDV